MWAEGVEYAKNKTILKTDDIFTVVVDLETGKIVWKINGQSIQ